MAYRVVYDVADDRLIPSGGLGPVMLFFALIWMTIWFGVLRFGRRSTNRRRQIRAGGVMGGLFVLLAIVVLVSNDYPSFADQRQCVQWARSGEHESVDGRVTNFRRDGGRSPPVKFQVGEVGFRYQFEQRRQGGFQGRFTADDAGDLKLQEGIAVRIAHRDGRILRIEIRED